MPEIDEKITFLSFAEQLQNSETQSLHEKMMNGQQNGWNLLGKVTMSERNDACFSRRS